MEAVAQHADQIALIVGAFIAVATAVRLLSRGIERCLTSIRAWRRRRNLRGLVLQPSPEEIAKFSLKLPQRQDPEEAYHHQYQQTQLRQARAALFYRQQARFIVLIIIYSLLFVGFASRFVMLAL